MAALAENALERPHAAWLVEGERWTPVDEVVALEAPVSLFFDGRFVGAVSCTPWDLEDLAVGFLFTSGVVRGAQDIGRVVVEERPGGWDVEAFSCGLAGEGAGTGRPGGESASNPGNPAAPASAPAPGGGKDGRVPPAAVHRASAALPKSQELRLRTGATHAAAFCDLQGAYRCVREDLGRHNAVDKLIGALLRSGEDPSQGFVHLSSRCALDLVAKCARFGIRLVSTVSAPTTAVIDFALEEGVTLCAFARNGRFTVYTHPERLLREPGA